MSKVAHYLQEHLVGEVMYGTDARRYFATDASILQVAPALVVYPRNENDVRKTARFTWQLAERGRVIPITARGSGTDLTGAALGNGLMMVFPAHMNRVLELDTKSDTVTVEPGINFGKLQQTLQTHGRFLPAYPASIEYSTVGGAVANNASGEKSVKYGSMRNYVRGLRVVLANGEVLETTRLSKRELNKKLGLATFEGEIYRSLDTLIEEQQELVKSLERSVFTNNAGYNLLDVKHKDGSFDLTPLFTGSQGTLGVISEIVLTTVEHNPQTTLMLASFDSFEHMHQAVLELRAGSEMPSVLEFIDGYLLNQVQRLNPNQLKDIVTPPFPAANLLVEFDSGDRQIKKLRKRAEKIFQNYASNFQTATEPEEQQLLWKLRQSSASLLGHNDGQKRAAPLVHDASVPIEQIWPFLGAVYKLLDNLGIEPGVWGHVGEAVFHLQPRFNLAQVGDRQKAFKLMDEYYKLVISMGGTIAAESGEGRLVTPYTEAMYGSEAYGLLEKVKQIFDPYGTLNPGVKFGTGIEDIKSMLRSDFGYDHLYDHLPRS
jgi:FAD/FMN-containing dehydrogenase